ncbi:hypothetical protein niasHT_003824 [Heterodera trifolii]|uniref:ABC transporter TMD0 domain-containing protein n=1 Tax=Heterodera trifolii TaxID=157864 RepID=A0ABD2LV03_9BILA
MYFCEDESFGLFDDRKQHHIANGSFPKTTIPRLSRCFQETVLLLLPALFLLFFSPLLLRSIRKSVNSPLIFKSPTTLRICICVFLILNVLSQLAVHLFAVPPFAPSDSAKPFFRMFSLSFFALSLVFVLFLLIFYKRHGLVTSGVLFNFWLLLSVCGVSEFAWAIEQLFVQKSGANSAIVVLSILYYFAVLLELFLSCFADTPSNLIYTKKACPEGQVSFLNQITFWWFNGMARLGHRRPLEMDDLWDLLEEDQSEYLLEKFEKIRAKQLKAHGEKHAEENGTKVKLFPTDGAAEKELLQISSSLERHF